ncbi:hypothetical protein MIR68_001260 [Amoeboaphelidium protococcarum]|nr:hypothetical protein MIR68_001260 [Amoeboaphelidium protococcarum]
MKKGDGVNESFVNDILNLDDWQEDLFGKLQQPQYQQEQEQEQYFEMDLSTDSSLVTSNTASDTVTVSNVDKRQITELQESSILLLDNIFSCDNNTSNDKNIADQDYNTLVDQSLLVDTESSVLRHFIIDSPNTSPLSTPRPKSILRSDSQSTIKQDVFKLFDQDELIKSVQKLELEKAESVTQVDLVQIEEVNEQQTRSQQESQLSTPLDKTNIESIDVAPTLQSKPKDFNQSLRPQQQQNLMNLNDLLADMDTILSGGQHTELRSVAGKSSSHSTATSSSHKSSGQIQFVSLMNQKQLVLDRSSVGSTQQIQQQKQSHRISPTRSDRSIASGGSQTARQILLTQEKHQESSTSQSNESQVPANAKTTLVRKKSMLPVRSISNMRAQMTKQTLSNYDNMMSVQHQQHQQQPLSSNSPFKLRKKASSESMKSQSLQQQQKSDIAAKQVTAKSNSIGLFRRSQPVIKKQNQPCNTDSKSSDGSKQYPQNSTTSSASLEQNKSPSLGINSKLRKIFNSNSKNAK